MPQSYFYQRANFVSFLASSLQIGLFSTYPANNGLGLELTSANAPGYSRRPIALTPILNMCASNTAAITWAATGDWTATAYYFGIFLASSGSLVYWGALPSFLVARSGGVPKIAAGSLLVDWTNPATGTSGSWGTLRAVSHVDTPRASVPIRFMAWSTDLVAAFFTPALGDAYASNFGILRLLAASPMGQLLSLTGIMTTPTEDAHPANWGTLQAQFTFGWAAAILGTMTVTTGQEAISADYGFAIIGYQLSVSSTLANLSATLDMPGAGYAVPSTYGLVSFYQAMVDMPSLTGNMSAVGEPIDAALPLDIGLFNQLGMMPEMTLGTMLTVTVLDATRGSTAGYTVAGPNALAF